MTISVQRFFLLIIGLLFCILGCTREHVGMSMLDDHAAPMETHEPVDIEAAFAQNLLPILTARCALSGCHVADGPHGLDFRTYASFRAGGEHGPAFIPGNAEASEIVEQIVEGKMPPPPRDPLTAAEIQLFVNWINQQEAQDGVVKHEHSDEHADEEDADGDHDDDAHGDDNGDHDEEDVDGDAHGDDNGDHDEEDADGDAHGDAHGDDNGDHDADTDDHDDDNNN